MSFGISLGELAKNIGAELHLVGDDTEDTIISSLSSLDKASHSQISFLSNSKYRSQLAETNAQAVILHPDELMHCNCSALVMLSLPSIVCGKGVITAIIVGIILIILLSYY